MRNAITLRIDRNPASANPDGGRSREAAPCKQASEAQVEVR